MYAVVTSGGKQYRVEAGSELVVERLAGDAGSTITFDRVLLVGDGEAVTVGTPTVQGASVTGTVLGEVLGPKLIVFKFKQKATYRRKRGHRQHLTRVRIDEIDAGGRGARSRRAATESATEPAPEAKAEPTAAPARKRASSSKSSSSKSSSSKAPAAEAGESSTPRPRSKMAPAKADETAEE